MLIKGGVDISRLLPAIRKKLTIIERIVYKITRVELVITSTYEGTHSAGSFHYSDEAVDIRRANKPDVVVQELRRELGPDYDVVLQNSHIHIEYDPK